MEYAYANVSSNIGPVECLLLSGYNASKMYANVWMSGWASHRRQM